MMKNYTQPARIIDLHNLPDINLQELKSLRERADVDTITMIEIINLIDIAYRYKTMKRILEQDYTWQNAGQIQPAHDGVVIVMLKNNKEIRSAWYETNYKEHYLGRKNISKSVL